MISALFFSSVEGDHSNEVNDFNIVSSSVEGYYSNVVSDFNIVFEFS